MEMVVAGAVGTCMFTPQPTLFYTSHTDNCNTKEGGGGANLYAMGSLGGVGGGVFTLGAERLMLDVCVWGGGGYTPSAQRLICMGGGCIHVVQCPLGARGGRGDWCRHLVQRASHWNDASVTLSGSYDPEPTVARGSWSAACDGEEGSWSAAPTERDGRHVCDGKEGRSADVRGERRVARV